MAFAAYAQAALTRLRQTNVEEQWTGHVPGWSTRFAVVDDLLPHAAAYKAGEAFGRSREAFTRLHSFRESKQTSNRFDLLPPILTEIAFALQAPELVTAVEQLTGIPELIPDPSSYAGGVSIMKDGDFLNPHIDNSHNGKRTHYRRVNLLYYLNPAWQPGDGGELELWDKRVQSAVGVEPRFNRLVLMETHRTSWHSVAPIIRGERRCISSYYFSERSSDGCDYYHVTSFTGRPDQSIKRMISPIDNAVRALARASGARRRTDRGYCVPHSVKGDAFSR